MDCKTRRARVSEREASESIISEFRRDPIPPPFPPAVWIISASVAVVESRNFRDSVAEIVSDG